MVSRTMGVTLGVLVLLVLLGAAHLMRSDQYQEGAAEQDVAAVLEPPEVAGKPFQLPPTSLDGPWRGWGHCPGNELLLKDGMLQRKPREDGVKTVGAPELRYQRMATSYVYALKYTPGGSPSSWKQGRLPFSADGAMGVRTESPTKKGSLEVFLEVPTEQLQQTAEARASSRGPGKAWPVRFVVLESVSRKAMTEHAPDLELLLKKLVKGGRAVEFPLYTSQAGTTSDSMYPLFAGLRYRREEFENQRIAERVFNASDAHLHGSWLWDQAEQLGYVTLFGNTFCNHLFGVPTLTHGAKSFDVEVPIFPQVCDKTARKSTACFGRATMTGHTLLFQSDFHAAAAAVGAPALSYVHISPTHSKLKLLAEYQQEMEEILGEWFHSTEGKEAVTFVMGDHGYPGTVNAAKPVMYVVVPQGFPPELLEALKANKPALVTSWDIRASVLHLLSLAADKPWVPEAAAKDMVPEAETLRATKDHVPYSLFTAIPTPEMRQCGPAGIPLMQCPHLKEDTGAHDSAPLFDAVQVKLDQLRGKQDACPRLELAQLRDVRVWRVDAVPGQPRQTVWKARAMTTKDSMREFTVKAVVTEREEGPEMDLSFVKQVTMYEPDKPCTPAGVSAEFCACSGPSGGRPRRSKKQGVRLVGKP